MASAIPGIGDTVALAKKSVNAVKGGLKSLKGLKNINALKKAKGIKKALAGMRGKAKTGASSVKKGIKNTDEAIDAIKDGIKELCTNGKCFTGDTLVYTRQGYKFIKEIRKGDEVYSRDEKTGETGLKEVFHTIAHTIYHVWVGGKEEFKTKAYYPVYVQEQGWVTAISLCEGDTIETMDCFVHITKVEKTRHEEPVPVYNFHVKDWTSYFVGKIKCYVHNSDIGKLGHAFGSNSILDNAINNGQPMSNHRIVTNTEVSSLPATKQPVNSSVDLLNPDGSVKQRRYYGSDVKAKMDIEFNHTDDGTHEFPHIHIWDWNKKPPRQDSRR